MTMDILDFHTHILPGMDDGAGDVKIAKKMLRRLAEQQVNYVCLTPHYYHNKESIADFIFRRDAAYEQIKPFATELGLNVLLGVEVSLTGDLINEDDLSDLCLQGTRLMLTEAQSGSSFSSRTVALLERLISNYDVIPVLAHIERYPSLIENNKVLKSILDMGCYAQINLSSLTGGVFLRRKMLKLISDDCVWFFGTDCHHIEYRAPENTKGLAVLSKKFGQEFTAQMMSRALRSLNIRPLLIDKV